MWSHMENTETFAWIQNHFVPCFPEKVLSEFENNNASNLSKKNDQELSTINDNKQKSIEKKNLAWMKTMI